MQRYVLPVLWQEGIRTSDVEHLNTPEMFPAISHRLERVKQANAGTDAMAGNKGSLGTDQAVCVRSHHVRPGGLKGG